jgi:AMMECR1 domain-containing protein
MSIEDEIKAAVLEALKKEGFPFTEVGVSTDKRGVFTTVRWVVGGEIRTTGCIYHPQWMKDNNLTAADIAAEICAHAWQVRAKTIEKACAPCTKCPRCGK